MYDLKTINLKFQVSEVINTRFNQEYEIIKVKNESIWVTRGMEFHETN